MLKNRNTVDVSSTKQRKQTIIMGLRKSALKNAKCLHRRRIFRYERHTVGKEYKHLTQPLTDFHCFFVNCQEVNLFYLE